ncbi:MAG: nucleoside phosphorylase, partial [Pseudomonadales bacterium]
EADKVPQLLVTVGDPQRVDVAAGKLTDVQEVSHKREYRLIKGLFNKQEVGVISHGVGSAGAGLCFEELCRADVKRIIRAGSAGGMQPAVTAGDIVIATAAVREDGVSAKLVPLSYPAFVPADLLLALRGAAKELGYDYHEGIALTSDMFYPHDILGSDLPPWQLAGVTAVEMEVSTLLIIAGLHGVEAGAVLAIDGNPLAQDAGSMETYQPRTDAVKEAISRSLDIALAALVSP